MRSCDPSTVSPIDWDVGPDDSHPLGETSFGTTVTDLPPVTSLLERKFGAQGQAMAVMNASSWYMDPAKLLEYARQFARGEREEAPITRSLRSLHVRPRHFWGCDAFPLGSKPAVSAFISVSFTVTDKLGEEWHLMLEVSPRQRWRGSIIELDHIAAPIGKFKRSQKGAIHVHFNSADGLRKTNGVVYAPHETAEVAAEDETEIEMQIMNQIRSLQEDNRATTTPLDEPTSSDSSSPDDAAAAAAVVKQPSRFTSATTMRLEPLSDVLAEATQSSSHLQADLERLLPHLLHLIQFSKWGPTLYTDNQPIAIRRQFTSMLLDEAMHVNSQPPLPTVLLDMIAEYAPLDLPYLEDEVRLQWDQQLVLPLPATRALYPGQTDNAIEQHDPQQDVGDHDESDEEDSHDDDDDNDDNGDNDNDDDNDNDGHATWEDMAWIWND